MERKTEWSDKVQTARKHEKYSRPTEFEDWAQSKVKVKKSKVKIYRADCRKIATVYSHNQDCDWKKRKKTNDKKNDFYTQIIAQVRIQKCEIFWCQFGAEHTHVSKSDNKGASINTNKH